MHQVTTYQIVGIRRTGWPASSKRQQQIAAKKAIREIAISWYDKYLPRHFEESAEQRYGYAKRGAGHNKKKMKRFGHTTPLVYTGQMKREALRSARITGGKKAKVKFKARRANLSGKVQKLPRMKDGSIRMGTYPPMRQELTAITRPEIRKLSKVGRRVATDSINAFKARKRTRTKR